MAVARMCPASEPAGEALHRLTAVDGSTRHAKVDADLQPLQRSVQPLVAEWARFQQAWQSIAKAPETQEKVAAFKRCQQTLQNIATAQVRRPVVAQRIRPTEAKRLPRRGVGRHRFVRTVQRARSCRTRPACAANRRSPPASDPSAPGCAGAFAVSA